MASKFHPVKVFQISITLPFSIKLYTYVHYRDDLYVSGVKGQGQKLKQMENHTDTGIEELTAAIFYSINLKRMGHLQIIKFLDEFVITELLKIFAPEHFST